MEIKNLNKEEIVNKLLEENKFEYNNVLLSIYENGLNRMFDEIKNITFKDSQVNFSSAKPIEIEINILPGEYIIGALKKAQKNLEQFHNNSHNNTPIHFWFIFNGIKIIVSENSDINLLYRDLKYAYELNWEKIGPLSSKIISPEIQEAYDISIKEKEKRFNEQQKQNKN